jgi:hypothetical protein
MIKNVILSSVLLLVAHTTFAQNYFLTTSRDGIEEVYIMSVTSNRSTGSLVVFDRIKPAEGKLQEFRHNIVANLGKTKVNVDNFDKLGYYRRKVQYRCSDKTYRIMEITYSDLNGKELNKLVFKESETQWQKIYPGTVVEMEFNKVCKK